MVMVVIRRYGIRVGEIWFEELPERQNVDIIRHRSRLAPAPTGCCTPFPTLQIDLTTKLEDLLSEVKKGVRYEIRRAVERDCAAVSHWSGPPLEVVSEFTAFYSEFARQKGVPPASRVKLERYALAGKLELSKACVGALPVVWHAYVRSGTWVRLIHSGSHYRLTSDPTKRAMTARANRYLHWKDIEVFKNEGAQVYDWGGYYAGDDDAEKLRINDFKRGFGGRLTHTYDCLYPVSTLGRLSLRALTMLRG